MITPGTVFARLTVLRQVEKGRHARHARYACLCECGESVCVRGDYLRTGNTRSCGCLRRQFARHHAQHGHARQNGHTPEYHAWRDMRRRCYDPRRSKYPLYGGRGIQVCESWRTSFLAFIEDMGLKPEPKHIYSIDRIDTNGNYEPGNCRWATYSVQNRNRRKPEKRTPVETALQEAA